MTRYSLTFWGLRSSHEDQSIVMVSCSHASAFRELGVADGDEAESA